MDYSLQRHTLLREVREGAVSTAEVCDATSYLLSASKYHGESTARRCPICRRENLSLVHYIFGDELRASAGQAHSRAELAVLAASYRYFDVYVVEVCHGCSWNHLIHRFAMGQDNTTPPAVKSMTPYAPHGISRPGRTGTKTK